MNLKDKNILQLKYEQNKGLIINYKLKRTFNQVFFHHIIIFDVSKQYDFSKFINKYYQRINLGDIISQVFVRDNDDINQTSWKQKTNMSKTFDKTILSKCNNIKYLDQILFELFQKVQNIEGPIIFNLLTKKSQAKLKQIQDMIESNLKHKRKIFFNLIGGFQTNVQVTKGINIYNFDCFEDDQIWDGFKLRFNDIYYSIIKITIQCMNGQLSLQDQSEWKTLDFNKITRHLKSPPSNYYQDVIHLINSQKTEQKSYQLKIVLQYEQLTGKQFRCQKNITILAMNQQYYQKTCVARSNDRAQLCLGIYSLKNPFKSETLVTFKRYSELYRS